MDVVTVPDDETAANRAVTGGIVTRTTASAGCVLVVACALACLPTQAVAQSDPNAPSAKEVKIRLGPVLINPALTFGNVGVDENVFNEPTNPKRDFTMTVSPKTTVWLPFLGTWFTGAVNEDIVWYQQYASERSANNTYSLNWKVPLTRVTVNTFGSHTSTRERPGFEIDTRALRSQTRYSAAVAFAFLTSTSLDVAASRDLISFDEAATFNNVNLHDELSQTTTSMAIGLSKKVTPLTTASVTVSRKQDRFPFNRSRDSDVTEAGLAVKFDAVALLKGNFTIGYINLSPLAPDVIPGFSGLTLAANLSYTLYDVTKISFRADRVVQNSYDIATPYYVQAGFNLEVAQLVLGRLDVVGRGGVEHLNYRMRLDVPEATGGIAGLARGSDRLVTYGVGVGYHLGRATRIGLNYDQTHRDSPIVSHRYDRPNIGTSVTYDF
jgi:Putative beta-barrel porin 2